MNIIDKIENQKLKEIDFPFVGQSLNKFKFIYSRPNEVVIFIIGGVTYEEAKEISMKNK
jgi:vacuolar protein sorting-associated protein 45